ncbi:MAG: T9SS type A sorting domain-containing protein [Bacteroidetes bacterium]|nr:MAG: T9SS type A sorting domain-containing protein [Bacteroidota bacterium]
MKNVILMLLFSYSLFAKQSIKIPIFVNGDTCNKSSILFVDADRDDIFDVIIFDNCKNKLDAFELVINSLNEIKETLTATLTQGTIEAKNFTILIYDPNSFRYTHKLYYDIQLSKAVLEDYSDKGSEPSTYEEADNYFYTQQIGNILLITKKNQIEVQSVVLCSLDGKIISNLQNVEGWSQFTFDMSFEPSGIYLLRFISSDRAMTKRVVYLR